MSINGVIEKAAPTDFYAPAVSANRPSNEALTSGRVLVVDDDPATRAILRGCLEKEGYRVEEAPDLGTVRDFLRRYSFDAVLLDLQLGHEDGLEILPYLVREHPFSKVFIITAHGTIDLAVKAMHEGASGFLTKPFDLKKVRDEINAKIGGSAAKENTAGGFCLEDIGIIGQSAPIMQVKENIERMKDVDSTVLVLGESGTGKELVARALHKCSKRANERFEAINCAAIPENLLESELFGHKRGAFTDAKADRKGLFEICTNGTLFLDEIGEMPLSLQAKLLRVLQDKEVTPLGANGSLKIDTRVIAATNQNLSEAIKEGRFRKDLFFRLSVLRIGLPPLRERREDIPLLVKHFVHKFNGRFNKSVKPPSHEILARLTAYDWPGNIRELQNSVERAVVLANGDTMAIEDLFYPDLPSSADGEEMAAGKASLKTLTEAKESFESEYLQRLLNATKGNVSEAARLAGRYRADMYRLFAKHNIDPNEFKP